MKDFKLPSEWQIHVTEENKDMLQKSLHEELTYYRGYNSNWKMSVDYYLYYPQKCNFNGHSGGLIKGTQVITTEQFRKYVLKINKLIEIW